LVFSEIRGAEKKEKKSEKVLADEKRFLSLPTRKQRVSERQRPGRKQEAVTAKKKKSSL